MNKITNIILAILVLLVGYGILKDHSLNLNTTIQENNTVSITGSAEKMVSPDTAKISFAVNEYNKSQKVAADKVNKKTNVVIGKLADLGIEDENIKTKNYSVSPQYNWSNGKREFQNYRVSQSVEIKIKDLEKVSGVLSGIVEMGIDNLNGPNMFTDNLDEIKDSLRSDAIADANKKAKELARELGVNLDKIVGFSESSNNYSNNFSYRSESVKSMVNMSDVAIEEPVVKTGEDKITKTVTIRFQIED